MSDEKTKAERALRALGRRVQHGLTKLEPVSEQHLAKVREAVRQQWEQTHPAQAQTESSQTVSPAQKKTKGQQRQQSQSQSHNESQDHGHSY